MYCTNLSQNEDRMVTKFGNVAGSPRISEDEIATPVLQSTENLRRLKPWIFSPFQNKAQFLENSPPLTEVAKDSTSKLASLQTGF
jgi:hypothetical protein